jgi:hypothetical protein
MADDDRPPRIRWDTEPGPLGAAFTGSVGTLNWVTFSIFITQGLHDLATSLPGLKGRHFLGTESEVKAEAERWLTEFAASLGAVFPPPPEWGVRFTIGGPFENAAKDEGDARDVLANMRELHPEWDAALLTRAPEIPAGPWKVADDAR